MGLSGEGPTRLYAWWLAGVGEAITRPTRRPLHSVSRAARPPGREFDAPGANFATSMSSGLIGALALTALHETARRVLPNTPRSARGTRHRQWLEAAHRPKPAPGDLFRVTPAGDVVSNAAYFSLVGVGDPSGAGCRWDWRRALGWS